jgi:hypothetical protein
MPEEQLANKAAYEKPRQAMRPPLDHGSRKVRYHVLGIDTTLSGVLNTLDKLLREVDQQADDLTWGEVVHLRRCVREAAHQVVHVIEASDKWGDQAVAALTPNTVAPDACGTCKPGIYCPTHTPRGTA